MGEFILENRENNEIIFEDIVSVSPQAAKKQKKLEKFRKNDSNQSYKNLDKTIKKIAYIVSIAMFLLFIGIAGFIFFLDRALIFLSAVILVVGSGISLIFLYLIYGLGHIISQNEEILRRLKYGQNRSDLSTKVGSV